MSYEVDVTVTVTVRKSPPGHSLGRERTGATLSQTTTRNASGPSERYWYAEAEAGAAAATEDVLKMMDAAYGRATPRT